MTRKQFFGVLTIVASLFFSGCEQPVTNTSTSTTIPAPQTIHYVNMNSELLGESESSTRQLAVLLPPSYLTHPEREYPVVYCLHGFGGGPGELLLNLQSRNIQGSMLDGSSVEYILIGVDGNNSLGGSFYVNSTATGNWEDYFLDEVIPYVDSNYRTLSDKANRAVAGFSMGGFGAWNLALKHADIFNAAWSCCPGAFNASGLENAMETWDSGFLNAYGAAFAPDMSLPFPHAQIPDFSGTPEDNLIVQKWRSGFGGIDDKIEAYLSKVPRLKSMRFDFGTGDYYSWIPQGTIYTASALTTAGLTIQSKAWSAGHEMTASMVSGGFIPYFNGVFSD